MILPGLSIPACMCMLDEVEESRGILQMHYKLHLSSKDESKFCQNLNRCVKITFKIS